MRNAFALLVALLALVGVYLFLPTPEERAAANVSANLNVPPPSPAGAPGAAPAPQAAQLLGQAPASAGSASSPETPSALSATRAPDPPEVIPCVPLSKRIAGVAGEQFAGKVGDAASKKYGAKMPQRCKELEALDDVGVMAAIATEFGLKP